MLRQDFVLRAIHQLGEALARIVGLRREDKQVEALEAIARAKDALPLVPGMVDQLSVPDLISTLEDEALTRQLAQLYQHEAELHYQRGDHPRAIRTLARSKALLEALGAPEDADLDE